MDSVTKQKILDLIKNEIQADLATIDPDLDLRQQILLDSMQFVGLAARIEAALDIELPISVMEVSTLNEFMGIVDETLKGKLRITNDELQMIRDKSQVIRDK